MKKLLLLIGIIFVSCSTDSEVIAPKVTTATKVTEMRTFVINYDTMATISDTGFQRHSSIFYSNDSNDCGKKLNGHETTQIGTLSGVKVQVITSFRYTVECN